MVTICLQCGVEGWDNAFVYCMKCLNEAVHRYCLDVIPKTFDEFVPWVCDVCEEESQKTSHSNSDARTQGKTCSGQIEVDSTITLNKKRIRHLPKSLENGHNKNEAGLRSPHKELDSCKDAKTQGKRSSEQIEVYSTITPKKKRISHSTESSENGHCKNGAGLQSLYEKLDFSEVPKTQGKACSEQIEVDSTITPNKKRISHSIESLENGHCKNGSGLQSPCEELDFSEDPKTQGKACSEQIEDDSTITLDKTRISHLAERVEKGVGLQSSHKEPDSSKDAELVSQYRPSRVGTKSIDDCSHMVLIDNEPRSPIKSSLLPKAKEVEVVSNGPSRKAKLRRLNDSSLLVTTNQSGSLESAKSDEDVPLPCNPTNKGKIIIMKKRLSL
ncbi:hypothetical protein Leryth_007846 [Lithospermum erythrorhizon]|nr:hypothetical protein Leryth_007846 [Lithospermum erythrorhizon]